MASINGTTGNDILVGTAEDDIIDGGPGHDSLVGGGGADRLYGAGGNDTYVVEGAEDLVFEAPGDGFDAIYTFASYTLQTGQEIEALLTYVPAATSALVLTGNEYGQLIQGNAGANTLRGGGGVDALQGLGGNDTYIVDSDDAVIEAAGQGFDAVYATASYALQAGQEVEALLTYVPTAAGALNLTGNEYGQLIQGNAGANGLIGGGGADTLQGLGGNDNYVVDSASDVVLETAGSGFDAVYSFVSYTLAAGQEVEALLTYVPTAAGALNLTGNEYGQLIQGNAGANSLVGGGGVDALQGLGGNDTFVVDSDDAVLEAVGQGSDAVYATASYTLQAGQEVEALLTFVPTGTAAINLSGNEFGQIVQGNAAANIINGKGGADLLQGGGGADQFVFDTGLSAQNVDTIGDFTLGVDKIVLAGGAGDPFAWLATGVLSPGAFVTGSAAADANDYIVYNAATGALLYDADGNGAGAAVQFATVQAGLALSAADFLVSGPVNNAPTISSGGSASIAENSAASTIVYQTQANDADGDRINYTLSGTDAAAFTIDANGAVRLVAPADFESRKTYEIVVNAGDSNGSGSSRAVTVSVTDVADTQGTGPTPTINETTAFNDSTGSAQFIDRAILQPSTNSELFDDDLPTVTVRGNISTASPSADIDFFAVTLNAGERLILDIDHTSGSLDTLVRVYDANGNELGFVDDSPQDPGSDLDRAGTTLDSFLSWRAATSGTYYFSVEAWGPGSDNGPGTGNTTGSYDLHVSIAPPGSTQQMLDEDIQALIGSNGWSDPNPNLPGTNLTFAFPNSPTDYPSGTSEVNQNFEPFNGVQQNAASAMLQQISSFANLTFTQLFDPGESAATLRYAMSDEPEVAYAYLPGGSLGGTAWFRNSPIGNRSSPSFDNPVAGSYSWMAIFHETGHALGLKHGHEFPAVSFDRDSVEYTVMTYRSYPGQSSDGYTNETWGYPTTMMALDIAALQRMYGPNFNFNSGNTVYSWSPTSGQSFVNGSPGPVPGGNRIFMTVWDGGGNDTYDFSNYSTAMTIDLRPGEFSQISSIQTANLGQGHFARGNVFNAFLYNGDPRSLIENAVGGSGNDTLIANQAANRLTGLGGPDLFRWFSIGDAGLGAQADTVTDFSPAFDKIDLSMIDAILGTAANDAFSFIGTSAFSGVAGQLRYAVEGAGVRIQGDVDGNAVADLEIVLNNVTSLNGSEFFF